MASKRLTAEEVGGAILLLDRVLDGLDPPGSDRCRITLVYLDGILCRVHNYLAARELRHRLWVQAARRKGDSGGEA